MNSVVDAIVQEISYPQSSLSAWTTTRGKTTGRPYKRRTTTGRTTGRTMDDDGVDGTDLKGRTDIGRTTTGWTDGQRTTMSTGRIRQDGRTILYICIYIYILFILCVGDVLMIFVRCLYDV